MYSYTYMYMYIHVHIVVASNIHNAILASNRCTCTAIHTCIYMYIHNAILASNRCTLYMYMHDEIWYFFGKSIL